MNIRDLQRTLAITIGIVLVALFLTLKDVVLFARGKFLTHTPYGLLILAGTVLLFVALARTLYMIEMNVDQYRWTLWIFLGGFVLPLLAVMTPFFIGN